MVRRNPLALCALGLFSLFAIDRAAASVARELSLEEAVAHADLVVEGRVSRVTSRARAERGALRPETFVQITVEAVLHGALEDGALELRLPGGRVGAREQVYVGVPTFRVGEQVILLLRRGEGFEIVGLAQGVYRVSRARDGSARVARDLRELDLVGEGGRAARSGERELEDLESFRQRLARAIEDRR